MKEIPLHKKNKRIWWHKIYGEFNIKKLPFHKGPYACLIVALEKNVKKELKEKIASFIIKSQCRYILCAGKDSIEWENVIDFSYLRYLKMRNLKMTDENFVATTTHKNEKIDDTLWYFLELTNFGYSSTPFRNHLILFIGHNKKLEEKWLKKLKSVYISKQINRIYTSEEGLRKYVKTKLKKLDKILNKKWKIKQSN